jgi:transposase
MKNKYIYGTHISERKTREIIKYFSHDIEAKKVAMLTGVSRPTINSFILHFGGVSPKFARHKARLRMAR